MRSCHAADTKALVKSKELEVHVALQAAGIEFEYQFRLPFKGCGLNSDTTCCIIDFVIHTSWGAIFLECDEHQHRGYLISCDVRRDFDANTSVTLGTGQKLAFLHFNPDDFKIAGKKNIISKKDRLAKLVATLKAWHEADPKPELSFARFYLFYSAASDDAPRPSVCDKWDDSHKQALELSFRIA